MSHFLAALEKIYQGKTPGAPYLNAAAQGELLAALKASPSPPVKRMLDQMD